MENNVIKAGIGFAILMAVGFIIVGGTRETQQEKIQTAFLQTKGMLSSLAMSKCSEAVNKELGTHPYTPTESASDNLTYVNLVWNNVASANRVECRYIMDQGVALLKVDDRTVIENTGPATSAPAAKPSAHH